MTGRYLNQFVTANQRGNIVTVWNKGKRVERFTVDDKFNFREYCDKKINELNNN